MTRSLLFSQYAGFITLGFILSIMSPLIESIRTDLSINYTRSGMILTGQFLGSLLTVLAGGYIADRIGKKPFLLAGSVVITGGLIGCAFAPSFEILAAFCVLTGVGAGTYEVGINALMADNTESESGKAMNFLHFFYGIGAIAAPVIATLILSNGRSWRIALIAGAALPVMYVIFFAPQKVRKAKSSVDNTDSRVLFSNGTLWLYGIAIMLYVGIETTTYGWIPSYWKQTGAEFPPQSIIASVFWATLTAGRIICGLISDKTGLTRFIAGTSIITLVAGLVWMIFPYGWVTIICIFTIGFSLAGVYPTLMAITTQILSGGTGKIVAIMTVFGSLGGFFIPLAIGRIADLRGILILPAAVSVLAFLMSVTVNVRSIASSIKSIAGFTDEDHA